MNDFDDFELDGAGVGSLAVEATEIETGAPTDEYGRPPLRTPAEAARAGFAGNSSRRLGEPLYFDLETIPDYSRLESFGLDPVPTVPDESDVSALPKPESLIVGTESDIKAALSKIVAPSEWIDKVAAAERAGKGRKGVLGLVEEARNVREGVIQAHKERRKLLSVTPEYCSIAAMGWAVGGGEVLSVVRGEESLITGPAGGGASEGQMLELFWKLAKQHAPLVAFNGLHFDLNVILVRSAILGVAPSRIIDSKPWGRDFVDPYVLRFGPKGNSGKGPGRLKDLAKVYGIDVPAEGVDGSQVEELMKTDPAKVGEYVRSDVHLLRELHRRLAGFFWA